MSESYCMVFILLFGLCFVNHASLANQTNDVSQFFINTDVDSRVVGGVPAEEGGIPYMVALHDGFLVRSFVCGASLVTVRSVLTAAHCIENVYDSETGLSRNLRGRVGSNQHSIGGIAYRFSHNITHPHYSRTLIKNDIGLLITTTDVQLSDTVALVPLSFDHVGAGVRSKVAGWGRTSAGAPLSPVLLELYVPTIDGQQCVEEVAAASIEFDTPAPAVEPEIELCTYHSPGYGTCNGDSGSPLVEESSGREIGIVSWSFSCARGAPDMFVRISAYRDWFSENLV